MTDLDKLKKENIILTKEFLKLVLDYENLKKRLFKSSKRLLYIIK